MKVSIATQETKKGLSAGLFGSFEPIIKKANATRTQIMASIQSNSTAILDSISNNSDDLQTLLNKWGNNTADTIIANITENRNQIISMQAWLNAFNTTEAQRHNDSQSLVNDVLSWLGIFNQSEAQRHNQTQTLINQI